MGNLVRFVRFSGASRHQSRKQLIEAGSAERNRSDPLRHAIKMRELLHQATGVFAQNIADQAAPVGAGHEDSFQPAMAQRAAQHGRGIDLTGELYCRIPGPRKALAARPLTEGISGLPAPADGASGFSGVHAAGEIEDELHLQCGAPAVAARMHRNGRELKKVVVHSVDFTAADACRKEHIQNISVSSKGAAALPSRLPAK